jgi:hypothetical protein
MGGEGHRSPTRFPVVFREPPGAPVTGALLIGPGEMVLEGRSGIELRIPYSELAEVRVGRGPGEGLHGRPALWVARRDRSAVRIEPLGPGLLHELADLLSALVAAPTDADRQLAVVVPLPRGRLVRAMELVAAGPPFDPAALGFTRHEVFLDDEEAVFVFAGPHVRETLEQASRDPTLWQVGLAWRGCIGGRPRHVPVSEVLVGKERQLAYSWAAGRNAT